MPIQPPPFPVRPCRRAGRLRHHRHQRQASPPAVCRAPYRDTIELTGRLSGELPEGWPARFVNGGFEWSQQPGQIDVSHPRPLGQTVATINVTPQQAQR
jgi:hypothetical protein